jgi:predicted membrane-bound spermidine synthase
LAQDWTVNVSPPHVGPDERALFHRRSEHQEILLTQDHEGHLGLTLDGVWQFHTAEERRFHELLTDPPMMLAADVGQVLVLGGGDGLVARNVLRYPGVEHVVLCELDEAVLEMAREVPELAALTERSLSDDRVEVEVGDAVEFLRKGSEKFDVVVCDFPACTREEYRPLFSVEFFASLRSRVRAGGVISTQVSLEPEEFWPILGAVGQYFETTLPVLTRLDDGVTTPESWANVIIGGTGPLTEQRSPPQAVRSISVARLFAHEIRNRSGTHFETVKFGNQPEFLENSIEGE